MKHCLVVALLMVVLPAAAQTVRPNPLRPTQPSAPAPTDPSAPPALASEPPKPTEQKMDGAARRSECSRRYQAAKAANTLNGLKWPAFYSACNTELKSAG